MTASRSTTCPAIAFSLWRHAWSGFGRRINWNYMTSFNEPGSQHGKKFSSSLLPPRAYSCVTQRHFGQKLICLNSMCNQGQGQRDRESLWTIYTDDFAAFHGKFGEARRRSFASLARALSARSLSNMSCMIFCFSGKGKLIQRCRKGPNTLRPSPTVTFNRPTTHQVEQTDPGSIV